MHDKAYHSMTKEVKLFSILNHNVEAVESGYMTKDLAILVGDDTKVSFHSGFSQQACCKPSGRHKSIKNVKQ